ncbi:hypothetical protein Dimus_034205 [Dionaea muscipula]
MAIFGSTTNLLSSLVVIAPEFSHVDDEEKDAIDAAQDSPKVKLGKPLSIDEAVASALAGFLSSTSSRPSVSSHILELGPAHFLRDDGERIGDRMTSSTILDVETSVLFSSSECQQY